MRDYLTFSFILFSTLLFLLRHYHSFYSVFHPGQHGNKDSFECVNVIGEFEKLRVVFI